MINKFLLDRKFDFFLTVNVTRLLKEINVLQSYVSVDLNICKLANFDKYITVCNFKKKLQYSAKYEISSF